MAWCVRTDKVGIWEYRFTLGGLLMKGMLPSGHFAMSKNWLVLGEIVFSLACKMPPNVKTL